MILVKPIRLADEHSPSLALPDAWFLQAGSPNGVKIVIGQKRDTVCHQRPVNDRCIPRGPPPDHESRTMAARPGKGGTPLLPLQPLPLSPPIIEDMSRPMVYRDSIQLW